MCILIQKLLVLDTKQVVYSTSFLFMHVESNSETRKVGFDLKEQSF